MTRVFLSFVVLLMVVGFGVLGCGEDGAEDTDDSALDGDVPDGDTVAPMTDGDAADDDDDDDDDNDTTSDGDTSDGDREEEPDTKCDWERDCPEDQNCDYATRTCRPSCDPTTLEDDCPGSETVCVMMLAGEGIGQGVCVPKEMGGKEYGQNCNSSTPCKQGLYCDLEAGRCTKFCDPEQEVPCENGLACVPNSSVYNLPICMFCGAYSPCEEGFRCDGGFCVPTNECQSVLDCPETTVCRAGYCDLSCASRGCPTGMECDAPSGLCHDACEATCAEGQCCLDGECGPCCPETCALGETCQFHSSCEPGAYCCLPVMDCTTQGETFCGRGRCDAETGICTQQCPLCPFGTECSGATGYECLPTRLDSTCTVGEACNLNCFTCRFAPTPYCAPDYSLPGCNPSCLQESVICGQNGITGTIACCDGNVCCAGSGATSTCCPPDRCTPGVGCAADPDGDEPPTCESCEPLMGTWCLLEDDDACSTNLDRVEVYRNAQDPCYISIGTLEGAWLNEVVDCGPSALYRFQENGKDCAFFCDETTDELRLNCQNAAGDQTCESHYWKSDYRTCEHVDGDVEPEPDGDEDGDAELEPDGDEDGDTELEPDGDEDGDAELELDGDEDGDTEPEPDGDEDGDTELEPDGDEDGDAELEPDGDEDGDTELEND